MLALRLPSICAALCLAPLAPRAPCRWQRAVCLRVLLAPISPAGVISDLPLHAQVGKAYGSQAYLSTTFKKVPRGTEVRAPTNAV